MHHNNICYFFLQILFVLTESSIAIRTKAMKCLTMVVEADPAVLGRNDMQRGVRLSFLDQSTSVREAAVDLVGKFVLSRPELIDKYYDMLSTRILVRSLSAALTFWFPFSWMGLCFLWSQLRIAENIHHYMYLPYICILPSPTKSTFEVLKTETEKHLPYHVPVNPWVCSTSQLVEVNEIQGEKKYWNFLTSFRIYDCR